MAPMWKIVRELRRLFRQLAELPGDLANYLFATARYDRSGRGAIEIATGAVAAAPKVAIYVIFPKDGLLASHRMALGYLREKGFAPFVVSNVALSPEDREALLPLCWKVMERPNFGYDFGGYRDAVLELGDGLGDLDALVLLNDSTWFPLPGSQDWLDEAARLGVDFAGATAHFAVSRIDLTEYRRMTWDYRTSGADFHYGSFALRIGRAILRDPDFMAYWSDLRLSDKKKRTVRRGEIGLTKWVLSRGFTHGATLEIRDLPERLGGLDEDRLRAILRDVPGPELPQLPALKHEILASGEARREDIVRLILCAVARQGASYVLAPYATAERGFAFLKKSPVWLNADSSAATGRLAERLEGPDGAIIRAEVAALLERRPPPEPG